MKYNKPRRSVTSRGKLLINFIYRAKHSHKNYRPRNGFTLIELLIVLLIISFSAGLVGILIHRGGNFELKNLTKHMAATMRYARNRAVSEKKVYSFVIFNEKRSYGLYADLPPDNDVEDKNAVIYKTFPEQIEFYMEKQEKDIRIDFSPFGSSSGAAVMVTNQKGGKFFITVSRLTGKVEIKKDLASE